MSSIIPMDKVKRIIYKNTELNSLDVKECKWRKPYELEILGTQDAGYNSIDIYRTRLSGDVDNVCPKFVDWKSSNIQEDCILPILYGDTIEACADAYTGYEEPKITLECGGGTSVGISSTDLYCKNNMYARFTPGALKAYTLTIYKGIGVSTVIVRRTSSRMPTASIGTLNSGATIYHYDTLYVTAVASSGYGLNSYTQNYTCEGNIHIQVTAMPKLTKPVVASNDCRYDSDGTVNMAVENPNSVSTIIMSNWYDLTTGTFLGSIETNCEANSRTGVEFVGVSMSSSGVVAEVWLEANGYADSDSISVQIDNGYLSQLSAPTIEGQETFIHEEEDGTYLQVFVYNPNSVEVRCDIIFRDGNGDVYGADYFTLPKQNYALFDVLLDSSSFNTQWSVEVYLTANGYQQSETTIYYN